MNPLQQKCCGRPAGIWIATVLLALFLVGALIRPFVVPHINLVAQDAALLALVLRLSWVCFFIASPLLLLALVGVARRKFSGAVLALPAFMTTPLFASVVIGVEALPKLICVGIGVTWSLCLVGCVCLFTNRRWFDEQL